MACKHGHNWFNAVVKERIELATGLMILRVVPVGWPVPEFEPGQFAVLGLPASAPRCDLAEAEEPNEGRPGLIKRAYSIASASQQRFYLEFYISLVPSGRLTPRLFALSPGDPLWLGSKVSGMFTLQQVPPDKSIVLVATGTGLAPYLSMLRSVLVHAGGRRVAVLHGARHSWELGYRHELNRMSNSHEHFTYVPSITRPGDEQQPWPGPTGYLQDIWLRNPLEQYWHCQPSPHETHVFLCGNPKMIEALLERLRGQGFREHKKAKPGQVHLERFW